MNTAVQLRSASGRGQGFACELLYGKAQRMADGKLGPIAVFPPGAIVAYALRPGGRRPRVFVFRTLDVDDRLAARVPGVAPHVQLLLALRSARRVRRTRELFAHLVRTGRDPSALPDAFYVRVSALLGGRLRRVEVLLSFLCRPPSTRSPWTY